MGPRANHRLPVASLAFVALLGVGTWTGAGAHDLDPRSGGSTSLERDVAGGSVALPVSRSGVVLRHVSGDHQHTTSSASVPATVAAAGALTLLLANVVSLRAARSSRERLRAIVRLRGPPPPSARLIA